ncbi:MAG: tetratricopeptide repeat protein [Geitlerinemataceae cyanobacterium]
MTVICLLGMHRSGTSCLAGSLQAAGLFAGEVHEWNPDNNKGQRENLAIMDLNNTILKANDGAWDRPPTTFVFTQEDREKRDKIISEFYRQSPIWMFKDPRTVLMLDFWHEGIPDLQFVGSFRHPLNVAMSLYQRNKMPISEGIQLWLEHNRCLLEAWRQNPFPLICFDLDRENYLSQVEEIVNIFNTRLVQQLHLSVSAARSFYASQLVHEKETISTSSPESQEDANQLLATAEKLYEELRQAAGLSTSNKTSQSSGYLIPLEETIEACQQIIEIQPDNPKVYFMLGNLQREQGEVNAAIVSYQTALQLEPDNLNIYRNLGNCFEEIELLQSAIDLYQTAIQSQPNNPELYCFLGKAQHKNGEIEAAISSYQAAIELAPKYGNTYAQLGQLFYQQEQFDRATECYQKIIELQPVSPYIYVQLGNILQKQANLEEAIAYYHQALELDSENFGAYKNMGDTLKQQEKWDEAFVAYQKAKDIQPENPGIHLILGNSFRQNDKIEEAIASYQSVLKFNQQNFAAYKNLGDLLNQQGKTEEAIEHYQKALEIQPRKPGIHYILGNIFWKKSEPISAIEHYQKAIDLDPKQPFALYKRLGDLLQQQGQHPEALSVYQTALKIQPENSALHNRVKKLTNQTLSHDSPPII